MENEAFFPGTHGKVTEGCVNNLAMNQARSRLLPKATNADGQKNDSAEERE